jgi:hypothetical protein
VASAAGILDAPAVGRSLERTVSTSRVKPAELSQPQVAYEMVQGALVRRRLPGAMPFASVPERSRVKAVAVRGVRFLCPSAHEVDRAQHGTPAHVLVLWLPALLDGLTVVAAPLPLISLRLGGRLSWTTSTLRRRRCGGARWAHTVARHQRACCCTGSWARGAT